MPQSMVTVGLCPVKEPTRRRSAVVRSSSSRIDGVRPETMRRKSARQSASSPASASNNGVGWRRSSAWTRMLMPTSTGQRPS